MGIFLVRALFCIVTPPWKVSAVFRQTRFIGTQSLGVIVLTGVFTGMVLGYQGFNTLNRVGSEAFLGPMVSLSLIMELGPVLAALMVTGRAGSAVAAELGTMRLSEQIDAIELMGLNPYRYLVVPNIIAGVLSVPLLTAIFDVIGIVGGYLVGVRLLGLNAGVYFGEMESYVAMVDIRNGIIKSVVFGGIIAWVCCFKGYFAELSAKGVGKATTEAVVLSSVLILVSDYFLTSVLW
jgi:phospholipid/cholesterol/gamma-HCH transport system permease protein